MFPVRGTCPLAPCATFRPLRPRLPPRLPATHTARTPAHTARTPTTPLPCEPRQRTQATGWLGSLGTFSADAVSPAAADGRVCELYIGHPLLFLNLVYIVVVDVGFYVIYLVQRSTWLIDPHWQLIPMS